MSENKEIQYVSKCPICGEPIYPFPADHDGHCHIIHKSVEVRIEDIEQRIAQLESDVK
jgi:hypothetical protein